MFLRRFPLFALLVMGCTARSESEGCHVDPSAFCEEVDAEENAKAAVTGGDVTMVASSHLSPRDGKEHTYAVTTTTPDLVEVLTPSAKSACGTPSATVKAKRAGTALLEYADATTGTKATATLSIVDPARITAASFADAELQATATRDGQRPGAPDLTGITLVDGGHTGVLLRYFDQGGKLLRGARAATFTTSSGLSASPIGSKREVAELAATGVGTFGLDVASGPAALHLEVKAVKAEAVTSLRLFVQDDRGAKDGQSLGVLARAYDTDGGVVYGAPIFMTLAGRSPVTGDLLRYPFRSGSPQRLEVGAGSKVHAETTVFLDGGNLGAATIGDSHRALAGCQAGGPGGGGAAGLVAVVALMLARRRREAGAGTKVVPRPAA